jgi:hypothetical protein
MARIPRNQKSQVKEGLMRSLRLLVFASTFFVALSAPARADEITDWNQILFQAALTANTSPLIVSRVAAIVQAAVFDAVNGIERRYTPVHVEPSAAPGASQRAAAVQAAYAALVAIYPTQQSTLAAARADSLANIASGAAAENSVSIARGIEWGQEVASQILAWRSTDGFNTNPPFFVGGNAVGQWRPTPPGFGAGAGFPQFATMTPWVITSPSQFRPGGPPALTSARYTQDFEETRTMGRLVSGGRTTDETLYSNFWNVSTAGQYWNQIARTVGADHHLTFSENARLLALVDLAMADAAIGCWEAKYHYVFWRPVTAIPLGATDGNPATPAEAGWTPLLVTPAHPEYPSGHSCVSGAAGRVLSLYFGNEESFVITTDVVTLAVPLGTTRSFSSFSQANDEVRNARIFAGIHFRSATDDGQALGAAVADYVAAHALTSVNGQRKGQTGK